MRVSASAGEPADRAVPAEDQAMMLLLPWPPRECSPNWRGHWSAEEDAMLIKALGVVSYADLSNSLMRSVQSIRNRVYRLGLGDTSDHWTKDQIATLKNAYLSAKCGKDIRLQQLADSFGKLKSNVSRKARELGLTDIKRIMIPPEERKIRKPKFASKEERSKHQSEIAKARIMERGHPRGALGMVHTEETLAILSKKSADMWASMTKAQREEQTMKMVKGRAAAGFVAAPGREKASWGAGWREIGGIRKYYRSKWEANYARYLEWLRLRGEIAKWEHEPETFWFGGIKRGCMSYLPDFRVTENGGQVVYHEVKGWMDDRSKTKIRRMAKYHPEVRLIVIDGKGYAAIKRTMQPLIVDWEVDAKGR